MTTTKHRRQGYDNSSPNIYVPANKNALEISLILLVKSLITQNAPV